jgi:hypothetical protein
MNEKIVVEAAGTGWVVSVNSDLTEGRGRLVITAVCETQATADRIAKGVSTQGCNGIVRPVPLLSWMGDLYGPITLVFPTAADTKEQIILDKMCEAFKKAIAAGLSEEDVADLRGNP